MMEILSVGELWIDDEITEGFLNDMVSWSDTFDQLNFSQLSQSHQVVSWLVRERRQQV